MTAEQSPDVNIQLERPYRPTRAATFHLVTTVVAPSVDERQRDERPPLNLSFIVDRSGSMSGGKLDLARQGVEYALNLLDKRDTVSLVVYDNEIDLLLTQRKAGRDARDKATRRLRRIHPRGSTALAEGWATGCSQLASIADEDKRTMCRAILLTDGLANVGETDPTTLARDAGELAARGITTTTFGVGASFDEVLLAGMADSGRGRYHYIANNAAIARVFAGELGELLHVTMRDVDLSLRVPRGWKAQILNDLPLVKQGRWQHIHLGDIASGDARPIVWAITAPDGVEGDKDMVEIQLRWTTPDGVRVRAESFERAIEVREDAGPVDESVLDRVGSMMSARAQAEALEHNRAGRFHMARQTIQASRQAMPMSAATSSYMAELGEMAEQLSAPLTPDELKSRHFNSRRAARAQRDYSADESR